MSLLKYEKFAEAFTAAGSRRLGLDENLDFNGIEQEGYGSYPVTIHNGNRMDTGTAFVKSISRSNLTVMDNTIVHKVIIENGKCVGD